MLFIGPNLSYLFIYLCIYLFIYLPSLATEIHMANAVNNNMSQFNTHTCTYTYKCSQIRLCKHEHMTTHTQPKMHA